MRASELLSRRVVDAAGRRIGRVRDIRVVADGPPQQPSGHPALRLEALFIGPRGGDRLGYGRTVAGPWPLAALFTVVGRRQYDVPWSAVAEVGPTIVLRLTLADLGSRPRNGRVR